MDNRSGKSTRVLTAEELKKRLYQAFRDKGWEDSLKAQLRKKLVIELQQDALLQTTIGPNDIVPPQGEGALLLRAANSLIADHLRRCQYDYSLSVFLPESGTSKDKMFTVPDLLDLLHIHPKTSLYKKLAHELPTYSSKGVFWQLLCEVAQRGSRQSLDKGIQVTDNPEYRSSIEQKLSAVDEHFQSVIAEGKVSGEYGIEERLLKIQRQADTRSKEELATQMSHFRTNEFKRMELEEREKCRQEIAKARKEMERTYHAKLDAVQERERTATERIKHQQQMMERETYSQRQNLLEELRILRHKETDLRREAEVNVRAAKLEEDKRKAIEDNLKFRESAMNNIEGTYERKLKEEARRVELDYEIKWIEKLNQLEKRENQLKGEKKEVFEERLAMKRIDEELREKSKRTDELEDQLKQLRAEIISENHRNQMMAEKLRNVVDYPNLKENNAVLKRELENTQMRLAETLSDQKAEKSRNEELLKQLTERMSRPSPELVSLRGELERTRDKLQQEKAIAQQKEEHWKLKVQEESQRNNDMQHQLEEQGKQMREMLNEIGGLRKILQQTQTALRNEVFRQEPGDINRNGFHHPQGRSTFAGGENTEDIYFDSSFRKSHLDTQLQLADYGRYEPMTGLDSSGETESNDGSQVGGPFLFVEETKARMRQLEQEAENLERNYQEFQQRMRDPVSHLTSNQYRVGLDLQPQLRSESTRQSPGPGLKLSTQTRTAAVYDELPTRNGDNNTFMGLMNHNRYPGTGTRDEPAAGESDWLTRQKPVLYQERTGTSIKSRTDPVPVDPSSTSGFAQGDLSQTVSGNNLLQQQYHETEHHHQGPEHHHQGPEHHQHQGPEHHHRQGPEHHHHQGPEHQPRYQYEPHRHYEPESLHMHKKEVHYPMMPSSQTTTGALTRGQYEESEDEVSRDDDGRKEGGSLQDIRQGEIHKEYKGDVSKDQGDAERQRSEEEREQREWEERRRKKEEERRKKEEEAREREHQMLLRLQQEEKTSAADDKPNGISKEEQPIQGSSKSEETKNPSNGQQIDPMMQKYMEMVQQKRQQQGQAKGTQNVVVQRQESHSSEPLSLGSMSADELELEQKDDPKSTERISNGGDPFDDW